MDDWGEEEKPMSLGEHAIVLLCMLALWIIGVCARAWSFVRGAR